MREPAPPYVGEGPHALWHVSEDPTIERFEPHRSATASSSEPRVWAVDTRHLPLYWFPRECPRGTVWATSGTSAADSAFLGGSSRVHLVEDGWLDAMRTTRVVAYQLAMVVFLAPYGIVAQPIHTAVLPGLSADAAAGDRAGLHRAQWLASV